MKNKCGNNYIEKIRKTTGQIKTRLFLFDRIFFTFWQGFENY